MEIFSITANAILIRPWQESDRPFLRTLYLHARREAWPWQDSADWQLEDFDAATRDEVIWVAVQKGHRLGFASVWTNDNELLEHVQKTFTSTGPLKCLVKNARAIAFYQRHGWHIEATGDSPDGEYYLMHYRLG
jgi:ribosomal protein S18 acetylase RimI-like enzyme